MNQKPKASILEVILEAQGDFLADDEWEEALAHSAFKKGMMYVIKHSHEWTEEERANIIKELEDYFK